ncbi:MAG: LysR substrate-binding domain-containing protein, partial [Nocardioidaceae bacterium]
WWSWIYSSGIMNDLLLDPRRLELLLELSRLGSMREVAATTGVTTSTVSQQIAALARQVGTPLVEPDGRRVRLTPAGRRLATHAVSVLAAIEAARLDLDPTAVPVGTVRIAAFASAVRRWLLPVVRLLTDSHPDVHLLIHEHEPAEALGLLAGDDVDLALTYDYNLAPATFDPTLSATPLGESPWALGCPSGTRGARGDAREVFAHFAGRDWIVNSRNTADDEVVRTLAAMAGFRPRIAHRADSLELVQDMVAAGLGVGLLPASTRTIPGVSLRPLEDPGVVLRAYAVTRGGRAQWPPLGLVLGLLTPAGPDRRAAERRR